MPNALHRQQVSVRASLQVSAPEFPLGVLPAEVCRLVVEGAQAIGCAPDYLAVPALVVAGGVIGKSVCFFLKDGYSVSSALFAAIVGPRSSGKTSALNRIAGVVPDMEEDTVTFPDFGRVYLDDASVEAIPSLLAENPIGLIMVRDQLPTFRNPRRNHRALLKSLWSGQSIIKDRVRYKDTGPIRCRHPFFALVGGIEPDRMRELAGPKGCIDGFAERFLFAFPNRRPVPRWSEADVSVEASEGWVIILENLRCRAGNELRCLAHFTDQGRARWITLHDAHVDTMNATDFPSAMRGTYGKLLEYAGRLALVLGCLRHACEELDSTAAPQITESDVNGAWMLVDYFAAHARRAHALIGL